MPNREEMIGRCPKCEIQIPKSHPYSWCHDCGAPLPPEITNLRANRQEPPTNEAISGSDVRISQQSFQEPGLSVVFKLLAVLELGGGFVLGLQLWPEVSAYSRVPTEFYLPGVMCIAAGVIFGAGFWAVGDVLAYLKNIRDLLTGPNGGPAANASARPAE